MEKELAYIFERIRLLEDWKEALFIRLSYFSTSHLDDQKQENENRILKLSTDYTINNIEMQLLSLYQSFEQVRYA